LQRQVPVHLTATATYADRSWKLLFVQDATGGVRVENADIPQGFRIPQLVEINGIAGAGGKSPLILQPTVMALGSGSQPAAVELTGENRLSAALEYRRASVRGKVLSADLAARGRLKVVLDTPDGEVQAWVYDFAGVDYAKLEGSNVH